MQDWVTWGNKCLEQSYDPSTDHQIKKWELTLTGDAFVRLNKTYQNGKREYYSLHLNRFSDMNYLGTISNGMLQLKASGEDIIVQTYNDPQGNVDSMASELSIPVKDMQPERLDSLQEAFKFLRSKEL